MKKLIEKLINLLFKKREIKTDAVIPVQKLETNISEKNNVIQVEKEEDLTMAENKDMVGSPADISGLQYKQFNNLVVVLDPGHAKSTNGKKSPYSLKKVSIPELPFEEWQFSREMANLIKNMLQSHGVEVFITTDMERDGETDVALSTRATRANDYVKKSGKKGVFISIHADADGMGDKWTKAHGWSCFTTKGQNNSDKLADCLYDFAEEMFKPLGLTIRTDKSDGDRDWEQDFTVIFKANTPAVLTENFFYTNIDDTRFLISEEGKNIIAKMHVNGILKFAETVYKM